LCSCSKGTARSNCTAQSHTLAMLAASTIPATAYTHQYPQSYLAVSSSSWQGFVHLVVLKLVVMAPCRCPQLWLSFQALLRTSFPRDLSPVGQAAAQSGQQRKQQVRMLKHQAQCCVGFLMGGGHCVGWQAQCVRQLLKAGSRESRRVGSGSLLMLPSH
jgi:hypothetical protein